MARWRDNWRKDDNPPGALLLGGLLGLVLAVAGLLGAPGVGAELVSGAGCLVTLGAAGIFFSLRATKDGRS